MRVSILGYILLTSCKVELWRRLYIILAQYYSSSIACQHVITFNLLCEMYITPVSQQWFSMIYSVNVALLVPHCLSDWLQLLFMMYYSKLHVLTEENWVWRTLTHYHYGSKVYLLHVHHYLLFVSGNCLSCMLFEYCSLYTFSHFWIYVKLGELVAEVKEALARIR